MKPENQKNTQPPMQSPLKGKFQNLKNNETPKSDAPVVPQTKSSETISPTVQELKPKTNTLPANVSIDHPKLEKSQSTKAEEIQETSPLNKITRERFASAFRVLFVVLFSSITFFGGFVAQQEIFTKESDLLPDTNVSQYIDPNKPSYTSNPTYEEIIDFTDWYSEPKDTTFVFRSPNNQQQTVDGYELLSFGFTNLDGTDSLLLDFESYILGYEWKEAPGNSVGEKASTGIKKGYIKGDKFIIINYREYNSVDSIESKLIVNFN